MATPTEEVDALKASLASASTTAKTASTEAGTYNSQVSAIDKQLSSFAIPSGKVGVTMSPQELLAFQLQSIDNNAVGRTPEQTAELKSLVEQRAKVAVVAQEKNAIANQAYKAADAIDIQLEQKETALASSNTATIAPAPASAAPGEPTAYTPPPTTTPTTTAASQTTPTVSEIESRAAQRTALVADKGEPELVRSDPNNRDVVIYTYRDGSTARRTGGRNAQIVPDAPVDSSTLNSAAKAQFDLAAQKKAEADAMQSEVDRARAQSAADSRALDTALASGDAAAIAAADKKFTESSAASIAAGKAQIELQTESRQAANESAYLQSVNTNQDIANANGGGAVAPTSVTPTEGQPPATAVSAAQIQTTPGLVNTDDGTGGFRGNAISDSQATTITVENGITTKTQVFANTAVTPEEDPAVTPNEDGAAEGGNTVGNFANAPEVVPNDDGAAEGGNTVGNFLNEPPVVPNEDGAAEGGNTAANPQNDDGAAEGGNTVGNFLQEPPVVPNEDGAAEGGNTAADAAALANNGTQDNGDGAAEGGNTVGDIQPPPPNPPSFPAPKDWRVRISLAPGAKYFYGDDSNKLLAPLAATGGVIFPYTPTISVSYNAKYDTQSLTHTNYAAHTYAGSSVDNVSITAEFTAQDVNEANYMLAVIHFFRSATKMFYGNDQTPARGTPPPLLYLTGYGQYQFDQHPMVLTNFTYSSPVDVDYINAYPGGTTETVFGVTLAPYLKPTPPKPTPMQSGLDRLFGSGLKPGAKARPPVFANPPKDLITRVPTKISISLSFLPIVNRRAVVNGFSLEKYANGSLLQGSKNPQNGGGLW